MVISGFIEIFVKGQGLHPMGQDIFKFGKVGQNLFRIHAHGNGRFQRIATRLINQGQQGFLGCQDVILICKGNTDGPDKQNDDKPDYNVCFSNSDHSDPVWMQYPCASPFQHIFFSKKFLSGYPKTVPAFLSSGFNQPREPALKINGFPDNHNM
jgi:hypothetical protein